MVTLPKFRLAGMTVSVPVGLLPTPARETLTVGFDAFEVIESVDVNDPAVVGANVTVKLMLAPAARVYGKYVPLTLKPDPVMLTPEILTLEPPVLEHVSVCV